MPRGWEPGQLSWLRIWTDDGDEVADSSDHALAEVVSRSSMVSVIMVITSSMI